MKIMRVPINKLINISVKLLNNIDYDKYFHLSLVVTTQSSKTFNIEKNERINIDVNKSIYLNRPQLRIIRVIPSNLTIKTMLENCRNQMGDEKYFTYHPFNNNCQVFISNLLSSNNISGYDNYINQDVNYINQNYSTLGKASSNIINSYGLLKSLF
jgi:hypothetical protein